MASTSDQTLEPPRTLLRTIRFLGPGLIVAGAIVGSGELIATTKTGAQAGINLLWLIIAGCLIKVFVQVELGRYAVTHGQTTLAALNSLPGPKFGVHPVLIAWLAMMVAAVMQLGGIIGGVGQAMALAVPLKGDTIQAIRVPAASELQTYLEWNEAQIDGTAAWLDLPEIRQRQIGATLSRVRKDLERSGEAGVQAMKSARQRVAYAPPTTLDDKYWATVFAILTMAFLFNGRYGVVQALATTLVFLFTIATIVNVVGLQLTPDWRITTDEIIRGLSFRLPETERPAAAIGTALATFGIIGVGATELISYPYWVLEKGYARYTGPRVETEEWFKRAAGWLRILRLDAFASMVVYTVATVAFFLTGTAVLHRSGLDPEGIRMVATLQEAYLPVFGPAAATAFLVGAVAVLYSTFLVAIASQSRIFTDAFGIFGLLDTTDERLVRRSIRSLGVLMPAGCLLMCWAGLDPVRAVLVSGIMQAFMLPVLAAAALYFRFYRVDERLAPGRLWDAMLIVSAIGLLIAGAWGIYIKLQPSEPATDEKTASALVAPRSGDAATHAPENITLGLLGFPPDPVQ